MKCKSPKPIYLLAAAMLFTATTFTACGGGDKKKDEPAKTDTPVLKAPDTPVVTMPDTPAKTGDTLKPKEKPTAQGD